jgi:prepilin-type N-terminal cleavage/methylation domain-containing protein
MTERTTGAWPGHAAHAGFSLVELLVSMTLLVVALTGVTQLSLESARINRAQQMTAQVQANARNSMAMVLQMMRSAGWDPINAGIPIVAWDAVPADGISEMEIFADLDQDGATDSTDEQVLVRHVNDRILVRRSSDVLEPFTVVATHITNDEDGDGVAEPMFEPVPDPNPSAVRVRVRITARSPIPDPMTQRYIRYTVRSEVALRKTL